MPYRASRRRLAAIVLLFLFTHSPFASAQAPAEAQGTARPVPQVALNQRDAEETRSDFEAVLRRLPPEVGRVMRLDPSLMRNETYLAPYPVLSAFLQQHPEVVQNPSYYLEHIDYEFWNPRPPDDPRTMSVHAFNDMMQGLAVILGLGIAASVLLWIIRTLIEYRRWYRMSKVQAEVHNKLMDRLTANDDLMAYIKSPTGQRFLESAPIALEGPTRSVGAPVSRIMWSLQAGIVLAVAALGILFVSGRVIEEIAQPLFGLGVLVLALGTGFIVSAGASYVLSRRLGLLDSPPPREQTGVTAA